MISTPLAIKDTGLFYFSIYKDSAYTSKIAELTEGIYIKAGDLSTGVIDVTKVVPLEPGVQVVTEYTIAFITEHTLYGTELGGSSLNI